MIRYLLLTFALLAAHQSAFAQAEQRTGEITTKPICGALINKSEQTIMGTLATAGQKIASGEVVNHEENFELEAGTRKDFCSTGPFYEGQRLELTLRTLFPLFSCQTQVKEIYLDAKRDKDGTNRLSAVCY